MGTTIHVAAVIGIAAGAAEEEDVVLGADPLTAAAAAEAVMLLTNRLAKMVSSNSRAMIAGRSQSAQVVSMGARADHPAAVVVAAATEAITIAAATEDTTAGGRRAAVETSITQNWAPGMNVWSRSCLASATRASISTNMRIYPWRRRARMCPRTSHRSMMCS